MKYFDLNLMIAHFSDYDPCISSATVPCENGGQCVAVAQNGTMCVCPAGYIGALCETQVLECVSSPCVNNGTCTDGVGNFTCQCSSGYTGTVRGYTGTIAGYTGKIAGYTGAIAGYTDTVMGYKGTVAGYTGT